MQLLIYYWN